MTWHRILPVPQTIQRQAGAHKAAVWVSLQHWATTAAALCVRFPGSSRFCKAASAHRLTCSRPSNGLAARCMSVVETQERHLAESLAVHSRRRLRSAGCGPSRSTPTRAQTALLPPAPAPCPNCRVKPLEFSRQQGCACDSGLHARIQFLFDEKVTTLAASVASCAV